MESEIQLKESGIPQTISLRPGSAVGEEGKKQGEVGMKCEKVNFRIS